ncbi:MAG: flagellar hook-length control protein FliK [Sporosarcina sp.]
MNIALMQATGGMNLKVSTTGVQTKQPEQSTFGSIFSSAAGNAPISVVPVQEPSDNGISDESILAIFNATSIEELEVVAKGKTDEGNEDSTNKLNLIDNLGNLEELSSMLDLNPEELIESLLPLLQKAGLAEDELSQVTNTTDFWTVLNAIDNVAPKFFTQLTDALEGKGVIPKKQAVDLLTLLKTAELLAPKTDLFLKQEQQVFSLQGYLVTEGEHFGNVRNSQSSANHGILQLMESKHVGQTVIQADKGSELTQQTYSSVAGNVAVGKGEITNAELENRNSARNETLIKEMQTIFKRANFGQTGGTNRLLIKLYPEHLGQVRIELIQNNGIMTARILASTALGKEMLDSQLHQLRSAFLQQNLQVERIDIAQTLQDTSRNDREQAFNQHFKKEAQETENHHDENDEEGMTFQEYMIELEV